MLGVGCPCLNQCGPLQASMLTLTLGVVRPLVREKSSAESLFDDYVVKLQVLWIVKWRTTFILRNFLWSGWSVRKQRRFGIILLQMIFLRKLIVYRMEFDKTRWSCSWSSDQNCTQNSARRWWGPRGWGGWGVCLKLTFSIWHNYLKLKMII